MTFKMHAVAVAPSSAVAPHPRGALQRGAGDWREEVLTPPEGCGLLLSVRRMGSRLTLSARATARGESRSRRRRAIGSAVSGVTRRSCGTGVKRLRQPWHQSRGVPDRFVPMRTTGSTCGPWGHRETSVTRSRIYGINAEKSKSCFSHSVTLGYNASAHADAIQVKALLTTVFKRNE